MNYLPLMYYFSAKGDNWGTDIFIIIEIKAFINGLPPLIYHFSIKGGNWGTDIKILKLKLSW